MRALMVIVSLLKVAAHAAATTGTAMQKTLLIGDDAVGRGAVRRWRYYEVKKVCLRQILAATSRRESLRQVHGNDIAALVVLVVTGTRSS